MVVFGLVFWGSFAARRRQMDLVARTVTVVVGIPLALARLVFAAPMALDRWLIQRRSGSLAVVGFLALRRPARAMETSRLEMVNLRVAIRRLR